MNCNILNFKIRLNHALAIHLTGIWNLLARRQGGEFGIFPRRGGYTFVEVLVAVVILVLVSSVGYVNFRDYSRRQSLISVSRMIKGDLRLAQSQALAGKKPAAGCNLLDGYKFKIVGLGYSINPVCNGGVEMAAIKTVTLTPGISGGSVDPVGVSEIIFKVLGQGTNIAASQVVLTLTQAGTGNTIAVTITQGGEIK